MAGVVRGAITANEKLELLETGKVFGSISTKNLVVHSGAAFIGKCEMPSSDEQEPVSPEDETRPDAETPEDTLTPDEE